MLYEELLTHISKSGPCYRWVISILISCLSLKTAFDMFILNLVTASMPFHCSEVTVNNETLQWTQVSANISTADNFSITSFTCSRPRLFWDSDGALRLASTEANSSAYNQSMPDEVCRSWTFMPDPPTRWTMFMEYSMVCDRQYLMNRIQTLLQFGICISTVFGPLGDIIGRKPILVGFAYLDISCNIAIIFVQDLTAQMVLRFFMGFGAPAIIIGVIIITEVVAEEYRGIHGNLVWFLFSVGYSGSAAISYFIHNWRVQTGLACLIAGIGYAAYIPIIPESPRWLLTRGDTKRAKRVLKKVCKFSGCKKVLKDFNFEHNEVVESPEQTEERRNEGCIFKILPRENLCRMDYFVTIGVVSFNYFTVSLMYYALSFKRDFITNDIYLNALISGLLEMPAYVLAWQLTNRAGRKYTTLVNMAFNGVGLVVLPFIPTNPNTTFQGSSTLAIAIKFSVTVSCSILAVYGSEVLPTKVRSCSYFFAFTMTRTGQLLAPELGGALAGFYDKLPPLFYGVMSVLASMSILLLPETKDRPMPNTVAEMEPVGCPCFPRPSSASSASAPAPAEDHELKPMRV